MLSIRPALFAGRRVGRSDYYQGRGERQCLDLPLRHPEAPSSEGTSRGFRTRGRLGQPDPAETLSVTRTIAGLEVDWVAHDVRKFARLMTRHNGKLLE
jgi:hypothetical protein